MLKCRLVVYVDLTEESVKGVQKVAEGAA